MQSLLILILFSSSPNLYAQIRPKTPSTPTLNTAEACKLNFPKLKSIFFQNSSSYLSTTPVQKDSRLRTLRQGVILKNGTEVRMIKSGCTHYIFFLNLRPVEIKSRQAEYLYELAKDQLELIPVEKDEEFNIKLLTNALDKRNWKDIRFDRDIYTLPCPEAHCTLRVIRENGQPRDLEIIYDKIL